MKETRFFGKATRKAVDDFQALQGWPPSGVGPMTWKALDDRAYTQVADDMNHMADTRGPVRAVWSPSGPDPTKTAFSKWAMAPTEKPFTVTSTTVINCWEMVLYAAFKRGAITWTWIHMVYTDKTPGDWGTKLAKRLGAGATTWDRVTKTPNPARGDIVMFDGAAHVALATGAVDAAGTHIDSFWPPPYTTFLAGGTPDDVKDTTIELLIPACDAINARYGEPPCVVTFGKPPW